MNRSDNILQFPDGEQVDERAAEWVVRLTEGQPSVEERAAFESWHTASSRHREAFARLSHLWEHSGALAELTDHAAADVTRASLADDDSKRSVALRYVPGRRTFLAAAVASAAFLVTSTLQEQVTVAPSMAKDPVYETVAQTAVGERRTVTLPDGSSAELNTASHLVVRYTGDSRVVRLTRGEAHFTVASDPQRPFSVHVADRVVTAVGTAFTVQLRRDAVEVTVAEGRVSLSDSGAAGEGGAPLQLDLSLPPLEAGHSALLHEGRQQVAILAPAELERKLAWRQGTLAFTGEPLSQVLQEIGRYTDVVIEVTDPALRDLPVAGRLNIDDVESMLQALQLMADVRVERLNDRHVRLRARNRA